jgi:hypothetical protein
VTDLESRLEALDEQGFVHIPGALSPAEVEWFRTRLNTLHDEGREHGENDRGTIWYDGVLNVDPERFGTLIAHRSIREELRELCGPQLQLRSMRGHVYPGEYRQHWHMDFYGYWDQIEEGRLGVHGVGLNTTFYFQDGGPDTSYLQFVVGGHRERPGGLDRRTVLGTADNAFTRWCDEQQHVEVFPQAGDCVLFFSHVPHRGIKVDATSERSNIVCHYQTNPFHPGVWFLSEALGDAGTYPFVSG